MGTVLAMAWRSIWRNKRRTLFTMSAVGIGLFLIIVYAGLIAGMLRDMKDSMDNTGMGHVEVYAKDYKPKRKVTVSIQSPAALIERLPLPPGSQVGARVVASGLATTAWGSRGVRVHGVDTAVEAQLSKYVSDIVDGEGLKAGDKRGVLVGERLAERLKLKLKSKLRLMVQRADGEMGAALLRVRGIYHSLSPAISQSQLVVNTEALAEIIGVEDVAHQIVVQLEKPDEAEALAAAIRSTLGDGYDVTTYGELVPMVKQMEAMFANVILILTLIVFFLVGLGILNTVLMSVLERTREFGVLMAIGTRPWRVVTIVLGESFWIATISVIVGMALGLWLNYYASTHPLFDWSAKLGESYEMGGTAMSTVMMSRFSIADALQAGGIVWFLTMLVGLYPAWRVSRLRPSDAIRAN